MGDFRLITENGAFYPDKNPPTWERPEFDVADQMISRWTLNATPPPLEGGSDFNVTCHEGEPMGYGDDWPPRFVQLSPGVWHAMKSNPDYEWQGKMREESELRKRLQNALDRSYIWIKPDEEDEMEQIIRECSGSGPDFEEQDKMREEAETETFTNVSDSRWYKPKTDVVKTPSHYIDGRKYEPRKVIQDWGLCWELGNALKYIARAGRKGDEAEDLRKAIEYLKYRLEAIEG